MEVHFTEVMKFLSSSSASFFWANQVSSPDVEQLVVAGKKSGEASEPKLLCSKHRDWRQEEGKKGGMTFNLASDSMSANRLPADALIWLSSCDLSGQDRQPTVEQHSSG